ncbi:MAG: thiamine pyrophosphate-binding protein [Candidatus Korobacteraceae bacterium]|jgi:acetolactate synthase-1/2/3 large subunit
MKRTAMRGADALLEALKVAGIRTIFTLSGNHVMSVYDAAVGNDIELIHVRQEGAAVHMADAWARMTGKVGVVLVTGGPGHANAISALYTAKCGEMPVVLLSGHAPLRELGLGAFQEMRQAEMAAPVTKASWTAQSTATLPQDLARAFRIAQSGRPGPVHLSLPSDVLEAEFSGSIPEAAEFAAEPQALSLATARAIVHEIADARRPLVVASPLLATSPGRKVVDGLRQALGVPVVVMESPRGINDPGLGAIADILAECDLIVLLGKALDFTLRFGKAPAMAAQCRWIVIDTDVELLARAARTQKQRLSLSAIADARSAANALMQAAADGGAGRHEQWAAEVQAAIDYRPWGSDAAAFPPKNGGMHSTAMCLALQPFLDRHADAIFVCDGGEIGQWAQAVLKAPTRIINGFAGAIGSAIPFAIGAKKACPGSPILTVLGDGTFGFHMAEFDTAVRNNLPFVAVVGNDAKWNAEYQIQVRDFGEPRALGCTLAQATRYDLVASALGGYGEFVVNGEDLPGALDRAFASGKPACVNVLIQGTPAPIVRRKK